MSFLRTGPHRLTKQPRSGQEAKDAVAGVGSDQRGTGGARNGGRNRVRANDAKALDVSAAKTPGSASSAAGSAMPIAWSDGAARPVNAHGVSAGTAGACRSCSRAASWLVDAAMSWWVGFAVATGDDPGQSRNATPLALATGM